MAAGFEKEGVDTSFYGTLRFSNDGVAQIQCSLEQPARGHAEIVGDSGAI